MAKQIAEANYNQLKLFEWAYVDFTVCLGKEICPGIAEARLWKLFAEANIVEFWGLSIYCKIARLFTDKKLGNWCLFIYDKTLIWLVKRDLNKTMKIID